MVTGWIIVLLAFPVREAFAPLDWDASLNASRTSGKGSKSIDLSWDTDFLGTTCSPDHLVVRYNKLVRSTATSPSSSDPKDGTLLGTFDTDEGSTVHRPLHATTSYAYTIYACEQPGCTSTCDANVDTDEQPTAQERWRATSVTDYDLDTLIDPDDTAYREYPGAIAAVLENG